MNKPGFSDTGSSGGGIREQQRGVNVNVSWVRFNINKVEEDHRMQRGIEARRKRKKIKKRADQNHEDRIRSTLEIILHNSNSLSVAIVQLCNANRRVGGLLTIFLDDFQGVPRNRKLNVRERLAAFRASPRRRFTHLPPASENMLLAMEGDPDFSSAFLAYLPSAVSVITSEDSEGDSPRARRLRTRRKQRTCFPWNAAHKKTL